VTDNRRVADKRSPGARLLALVLHPVTPPLWLGIVVAAVCIAVEGALALYLGHTVPGSTFGVVFLFASAVAGQPEPEPWPAPAEGPFSPVRPPVPRRER